MESASSWSNLCASTSVLQQPFPHAVVSSSRGCWCERSQKARKPGRANTVEANSGSLFKQMFMNIFCHICRVLIVIWLDGHMSLKVEDWIYRGRDELERDLQSRALESEGLLPPLHKHEQVPWGDSLSPGLIAPCLSWENTPMLWAGLLHCVFIHNCCFLCFPLLANIMGIYCFLSLPS